MPVYYLSESARRYHVSEECGVIQQSRSDASELSLRDAELKGLEKCENCPKPNV